ncbi:hypothetical protein KJ951_01915 [Patescibacteria group bacterium]|nr:hypothetical protein [Patescibacteria group bacterium]MBU1703136.1 hypothetical protein [Patescibacteria group bacterium]MBU1954138.1 hypothetical protein [Patescibacteria group bacterium]
MKYKNHKKGQTILEIVVAMGVFIIILGGVTSLYIASISCASGIDEEFKADMYLRQAFEATRAIRDGGFAGLANGTYGLSNGSGYWQLSGSSDNLGEFTRTLQISDVQRNSGCAVVGSGGTVDHDSKKITVTVNWDQGMPNPKSISANQYMHNWASPQKCGVQANNIVLNVSNAYIAQNKKLKGVTIQNIGQDPIAIDKVILTWTANSKIEWVKLSGAGKDWDYGGIGTPVGKQPSGTELDIIDFTINPGQLQVIDEFKFDNSVVGSAFSITLTLEDGSSTYKAFQI